MASIGLHTPGIAAAADISQILFWPDLISVSPFVTGIEAPTLHLALSDQASTLLLAGVGQCSHLI